MQRIRDGILPSFPIWDDIRIFDGYPWRGYVDIVAGGFPCQDISIAGKGAGIEGARSGLWKEMARVVHEIRPRFVFVENSPMLVGRGLAVVLGDLAQMGYDARWCVIGANIASPHLRERIWILAHTSEGRFLRSGESVKSDSKRTRSQATVRSRDWGQPEMVQEISRKLDLGWRSFSHSSRAVDDLANWLDRLSASGNGQVPIVAATAWRILTEEFF